MATPLEQLEGKYELLEKIREGGMGSVYKVRHRLLDEVRVIKVMRPQLADDETLKARFLREAKVAIRLRHPNLAQIYDFTMDDSGYAYLVMEFIDGLNLQEMVKVLGRPSTALVLEVAHQGLNAIGYLHRKRIIHRDISPDNLLVARGDEGGILVKLIDLGIAKDREGDDSLTSAGTFLGKVRYSSPEQFKTHEGAQIGARSDLYSFGIVLYELLTGTYPIKGSNVASLISGHLMHPPLEFDTSDPEGKVAEPLRSIVLKAMEKEPDDRFRSAAEFRDALIPIRDEHPVDDEEINAIFDIPTLTTRSIRTVKKPGSTQSRIDKNFGMSTTPPPEESSDPNAAIENSGTVEMGAEKTPASDPAEATQSQVRALLLGAKKLLEASHYEEARLQLAAALELSPGNPEALELRDAVEAADVKLQQRRQKAADEVRELLNVEDFDRAITRLNEAEDADGSTAGFVELRAEITRAKQMRDERLRQVAEMKGRAEEHLDGERFDEAVSLLRDALVVDPGDSDLRSRLAAAEDLLEQQRETERREAEIAKTVSSIGTQIEDGDAEEAERALSVARKLYGERDEFRSLEGDIEALRTRQRLATANELQDKARSLMEEADFASAIEMLERAHHIAPDAEETDDLLAGAREGLRLQEEAQRHQRMVDEACLRVDRLILAGRLESAIRFVDSTVDELGDFDEAQALRKKIKKEIAAADKNHAKLRKQIDQALKLSADDRFAEAEEALDAAKAMAPDVPDGSDLVSDAEKEIRRRIDAHRRQVAVNKVVQSIDAQLEKTAVEEAKRELAVARRLYGPSDVFDEIASKIEGKERELRRLEIDRLIELALEDQRPFDEVIADLESASALDPHDERVQRLLVQTHSAQRQFEEDQIEEQAAEAMAKIDSLIAEGNPEQALSTLQQAVRELGEFRAARVLRERLTAHLEG